jgi:hypothetical protein
MQTFVMETFLSKNQKSRKVISFVVNVGDGMDSGIWMARFLGCTNK